MAKEKKRGRALTGILCFIFGFIFAVIVEVAAIAVGVYVLLNSKIDDMLSTVGVENTDEDGNKIYINTDLEELTTVSDLINVIYTLTTDFDVDTTTLNDLNEYFPVIEYTIDLLYDKITDLITEYLTEEEFKELIDKNELMSTPIADIPTYIYDRVENSTLNDLNFDVYTDETLFLYMVYGITDLQVEDGVWTATYHFVEAEESDIETRTVTVVIDESNVNAAGGYLISKVYYIDDDGEEVRVGTKKNEEARQRLESIFDDLTISDFIEIDSSNIVLYALRNSSINSFASDLAALPIQQIFADSIYGTTTMYEVVSTSVTDSSTQIAFNEAYLYYGYEDGELTLIGHLDSYTAEYGTLYTYGTPQGAWKLLLYANGVEEVYTVNDISALQTNLTNNLGTTTLGDLCDMGILEVEESYLTKQITYNGKTAALSEFTLSEYISYTLTLLS